MEAGIPSKNGRYTDSDATQVRACISNGGEELDQRITQRSRCEDEKVHIGKTPGGKYNNSMLLFYLSNETSSIEAELPVLQYQRIPNQECDFSIIVTTRVRRERERQNINFILSPLRTTLALSGRETE